MPDDPPKDPARPRKAYSPCGDLVRELDESERLRATIGLSMTPAQRLEWLERAKEEMGRIVGLARGAKPSAPPPGSKPPDSMPA